MNYKVVIPTAGIGSRLGQFTKNINKSLVSVDHKPVIAHIIEKIPVNISVVIALGFQGKLVRQFLELAFPDRDFEFVEVFPFEGEGSGLGWSLYACKNQLQCPFIFWSCDALIKGKIIAPDHNWAGYSTKVAHDISAYRTLEFQESNSVVNIEEKGSQKKNILPYIGIAGVKDFQNFWNGMEMGLVTGETIPQGEVVGMRGLLNQQLSIRAYELDWFDMGNPKALANARQEFSTHQDLNVLEKEDEAIWFMGSQVIKYSQNKEFIKNRAIRSGMLQPYVPAVLKSSENMYVYSKQPGKILSKIINLPVFDRLLVKLLEFWKPYSLSDSQKLEFYEACEKFYYNKTLERIALYERTLAYQDQSEIINGVQYPKLSELLKQVNWTSMRQGIPVRFHGDLHFENILYDFKSHEFLFLDWRQDFGGIVQGYGDLYYDLAKLKHGLIICHELISKDLYAVSVEESTVDFEFLRKQILVECELRLDRFIQRQGWDLKKVNQMTALIFLNIAPLHHHPYRQLLYYLGKSMLI